MATKMPPDRGTSSRLGARRPPAPKASNYAIKKAEIVNAAARLFTERGYDSTNLIDIANAVNMDRATFYYYYKSKTHLLAFAMTDVLAGAVKEMNAIVASDADAVTKLRGAIECMLTTMNEKYPFSVLYFQDDIWRSPDHAALIAPLRNDEARIFKMLNRIITDGQHDGTVRGDVPADLITRIVFGSMAWSYRWFKPGGRFSPEDVIGSFDAILSSGVASPKTRRGKVGTK